MRVVYACLPTALPFLVAFACARGGPYGLRADVPIGTPSADVIVSDPGTAEEARTTASDPGVAPLPDVPTDPGTDPGGDPGGLDAADIPDVPDPACLGPATPAPFELGVEFAGPIDELPDAARGLAVVVFKGPYAADYAWDDEVRFRMVADGTEVVVRTRLPGGDVIPVAFGETVDVLIRRDYGFEYVSTVVIVWGGEGRVRFIAVDSPYAETASAPPWDCGTSAPCPRVYFLDAACPAEPGDCGDVEYPPVRVDLGEAGHWEAPQGGAVEDTSDGRRVRQVIGRAYRNVTMECVDYPFAWIQVALFDNGVVSQCECDGLVDCADGRICETDRRRCVPDLCVAAGECASGAPCDPYTGKCVEGTDGIGVACASDADCPPAEPCGLVCNRPLGICQPRNCCVVDCAGSCSDLLHGCYLCLSDCDCLGAGICDPSTRTCVECRTDKMSISRPNSELYEFYEVCIPKDFDWDVGSPEATVKAIDPTLYCGVAGGFAGCDPETETGCHGDLAFDPGGKVISTDKWAQLCGLSRLAFVSRIGGGHFVR